MQHLSKKSKLISSTDLCDTLLVEYGSWGKQLLHCYSWFHKDPISILKCHIYRSYLPLYSCDLVSVHFNHFPCMEICNKLRRDIAMLNYIYMSLKVDECWLTSSMPKQRFKFQIVLILIMLIFNKMCFLEVMVALTSMDGVHIIQNSPYRPV